MAEGEDRRNCCIDMVYKELLMVKGKPDLRLSSTISFVLILGRDYNKKPCRVVDRPHPRFG